MAPVPTAALLPLLALYATAAPPEVDVGDVSRAPDACPTQSQIAEALEGHMPGSLARVGRELGPNVLHLGLAISPTGTARVTLTDATGALRLERDLDLPKAPPPPLASPAETPPGPARERPTDCAAFAETLALIVERYMRHIGYHEPPPMALVPPPPPPTAPVPPPPPPQERPPRAFFGVGLSARPPWNAPARLEPEVAVDVRMGPLSLAAAGSYALSRMETVPMTGGAGQFTFEAFSGRVAVGWVVPLGERLAVIPALGLGADLVLAETQGIGVTRRSSALEPTVEAGASAAWLLTQRFWVGAHAFQGFDLRPEEFYVTTNASPTPLTLAMTPRAYVRAGVDFGITLGKN
jgi:hypothetical protein